MYALCFIVAYLCASAYSTSVEYFALEKAHIYFEDFTDKFGKQYENDFEKENRFQIFKKNLEEVNRMNKGDKPVVYGITQFMDLTPQEFASQYTSAFRDDDGSYVCDTVLNDKDIENSDAPDVLDWREKGAVTAVKSQGSCGACWAFSATDHIEGQYAIKDRQLIQFSEQQIVDCDKVSSGCHGGYMSDAFKALIAQGGQMKQSDYEYEGKEGACRVVKDKIVAKVTDCTSYNLTSQEKLKHLLYKIGPISVALQAQVLHSYSKGIIPDSDCVGRIGHAVLLVGYGQENGTPYWLLKNSWDDTFGEAGYFRLQRSDNPQGACLLLNDMMATATVE